MLKILFNILCVLMAIAMTACTNEELLVVEGQTPAVPGEKVSVEAYAPGGDKAGSRIVFQENEGDKPTVSLSWSKEERFSVVRGSEVRTFSKNTAGNTFTGTLPTDGTGDYLAFYPATASADLPVDLSVQTGALDSKLTYMYASSTDGMVYEFQHCVALLKVAFVGLPQGATIKQIIVNTIAPKVDGKYNPSNPTDFGGTKKTITINNPATEDIYIYLPPIPVAQKTLYFEVTTSDDKVYKGTMTSTSNKPIEAGRLYTGSVKMSEVVIPYITFEAASTQTFKMSRGYEKLEYSLDNGKSWSALNSAEVSFGAGKKMLLRGKSSLGTNGGTISFGDKSVKVACSGDIRTLVDYEEYATVSTVSANFVRLFSGCSQLTSAPELPATTLAQSCYSHMFYGCSSLTKAPALPATTLASGCYSYMFRDCNSLTEVPALPATTLASSCYEAMFSSCSSLTEAPALPATTLVTYCYVNMFSSCSSLTEAPALPATKMVQNCYYGMFSDCSSLTEVPALPATILAQSCYCFMFEGCSSLTEAPALPATTMARYCYAAMFSGCSSLTKAPTLPATTLAESCYHRMFFGCNSLNKVIMLATDISASSCLDTWVEAVSSTGTFIKSPQMKSLPTGASGIPYGWTVVDYEGDGN